MGVLSLERLGLGKGSFDTITSCYMRNFCTSKQRTKLSLLGFKLHIYYIYMYVWIYPHRGTKKAILQHFVYRVISNDLKSQPSTRATWDKSNPCKSLLFVIQIAGS